MVGPLIVNNLLKGYYSVTFKKRLVSRLYVDFYKSHLCITREINCKNQTVLEFRKEVAKLLPFFLHLYRCTLLFRHQFAFLLGRKSEKKVVFFPIIFT